MKSQRYVRSAPLRAALIAVVASLPLSTLAEESASSNTAADGTLHLQQLTIPPSGFWSPEFRAMYAKMVERARDAAEKPRTNPQPAKDAPKAEWDRYDASLDALLAEPLATVRSRYPVNATETKIAGVRAGDISPKEGVGPHNKGRVLINVHGGGFVDFRGLSFGQLESIPVASMGQVRVITLDYRQSPYFQYPAASEDVEAVYGELLKVYKPESIGIFGCSAGGALAAQAVAWFQKKGLPRPGAIGISGYGLPASPFPRPMKLGDSWMWDLGVPSEAPSIAATAHGANPANRWYMQGAANSDPAAYPGSSDDVLRQFPPTLFLLGTREWPMSMAVVDHARLLKLGVDSSLYLMEGAPHCAHVFAPQTPEARDASAYIARWFNTKLAP